MNDTNMNNRPRKLFSEGERVAVAVIGKGANVRKVRAISWNETAGRWEYDVGMLCPLPASQLGRL